MLLKSQMNQISHKTIARMLILLMLVTPLTGMAMEWSAQSTGMDHCDDIQMKKNGHAEACLQSCNMSTDGYEMCNSTENCANSSISLLNGFNLTIIPDDSRIFFGSDQSIHFSSTLNELFRPPRA
jgi:hypothetical protein